MPYYYAAALVVSTVLSEQEKSAARSDRKKSREFKKRIADVKAKRERTEFIRQGRIAKGQQIQAGVSTGTTQTSGQVGALAGISSQTGANVSFLDTTQSLAGQANIFQGSAIEHEGRAETISAIGKSIYSFKGT